MPPVLARDHPAELDPRAVARLGQFGQAPEIALPQTRKPAAVSDLANSLGIGVRDREVRGVVRGRLAEDQVLGLDHRGCSQMTASPVSKSVTVSPAVQPSRSATRCERTLAGAITEIRRSTPKSAYAHSRIAAAASLA